MKAKRPTLIFLFANIMWAPGSFATDIVDQTYEEYFADENNQSRYEEMLKNGKVDEILISSQKRCDDMAEMGEEKGRCRCIFDGLSKIDKRIAYYNSLKSFALFMYMVDAKKNGDDTEYQRLKDIMKNDKPKEIRLIEEECEKI